MSIFFDKYTITAGGLHGCSLWDVELDFVITCQHSWYHSLFAMSDLGEAC